MPTSNGQKVVWLLLVRSAESEPNDWERTPLSSLGRWQAERLFLSVELYIGEPKAILCSRCADAREHANIVSGLFPHRVRVVPLRALTLHRSNVERTDFAGIMREAGARINWERHDVVMLIGHEPMLGELAQAMTGEKMDELRPSELQCVEGTSWRMLAEGHGRLNSLRLPLIASSTPRSRTAPIDAASNSEGSNRRDRTAPQNRDENANFSLPRRLHIQRAGRGSHPIRLLEAMGGEGCLALQVGKPRRWLWCCCV
jgi:phosphohistidine phosphatase SixA